MNFVDTGNQKSRSERAPSMLADSGEIAILPERALARSIFHAKEHLLPSILRPNDEICVVKITKVATLDDGIEMDESFALDIPEVDVNKYGQYHV